MSRIVCEHLIPSDMECAECKTAWVGENNEKDAEIARLRDALTDIVDAWDETDAYDASVGDVVKFAVFRGRAALKEGA